MITQGAVYWIDFGEPRDSGPAKRRPVVVIQSDALNVSRLATTVVVVITSNTALASMPGNVFVPSTAAGLPRDSVVNVTAIATVGKSVLEGPVGHLPDHLMEEVERGVRKVLGM